MIMFLDITPVELQACDWVQVEIVTTELCLAFRRGDHIVIMRRDTVKETLTRQWPLAVRSTLETLALDYAQSGSLISSASCVLNVRLSILVDRPRQDNQVIVDAQTFPQERLYMPGVLLVENAARDGTFFKIIIQIVAKKLGIGRVHVEAAHGGGDDIVASLENQIVLRRYIVCIIDSDKMSPFCPLPMKATKIEAVIRRTNWKFIKFVVLGCHEIENLLHPELILGLRCSAQYPSADVIRRLISTEKDLFGEDSLWRYFDIKEGLNDVRLASLDGKRAEWVRQKIGGIGLNHQKFLISGFGANVVTCLIDERNKYQLISDFILNNRSWNAAFRKLIEDIAWRFAGRTPSYA